MGRAALLVCAALAAACGPSPQSFVAEPGALLVYATADEDGALVKAGALLSPTSGAARIELDGARIFTWQLPSGSFVDEVGQPLSDEGLAALQVRLAAEPNAGFGACGRCLAPFQVGPQVLMPGDSCSLPAIGEAKAYDHRGHGLTESLTAGEALEAARRQIRLERAGDCPCAKPAPLDLATARIDLVRPTSAPRYFGAVASAGTSSVVAFSPHILRQIDPAAGTAQEIRWDSEEGLVPSAAIRVGDAFLLSSIDDTTGRAGAYRLEWVRLNAGGIQRQDLGTVLDRESHAAALRRVAPGPTRPVRRSYAFGDDGTGGQRGAIAHCDEGATHCEAEAIECVNIFSGKDQVVDLGWDDDVGGYGAAAHHLLRQAAPGDTWRCDTLPDVEEFSAFVHGPQGFLVCGENNNQVVVYTAAVTGRVPAASELRLVWTSSATRGSCSSAYARSDGFRVIVSGAPRSTIVRFDPSGRYLATGPTAAELGPEVYAVEPLHDGRLLGRNRGNGLFLGPISGPLRRVYGDRDSDGGRNAIADVDGSGAWAINAPPVEVLRVDTATTTVYPAVGAAINVGWTVRAAALDHTSPPDRPRFAVLGERDGGRRELDAVELINGKASLIAGASISNVDVALLAEQWPGSFVVLLRDFSVMRWTIGSPLRPIAGSFDIPDTVALEGRPDKADNPSAALGGSYVAWFAVSSKALLRVSGDRFEAFDLTAAKGQGARSVDFVCPDDVSISLSGTAAEFTNYLRLAPATAGPSTDLVPRKLRQAGADLERVGDLAGAVPDGEDAAVLTEDGVLLRFDGRAPPRLTLPVPVRSARFRPGFGVIAGSGALLVVH